MTQITYDHAAGIIGCSPRQVRRILSKHKDKAPPIRLGYRTVRFNLEDVLLLKRQMTLDAIDAATRGQKGATR